MVAPIHWHDELGMHFWKVSSGTWQMDSKSCRIEGTYHVQLKVRLPPPHWCPTDPQKWHGNRDGGDEVRVAIGKAYVTGAAPVPIYHPPFIPGNLVHPFHESSWSRLMNHCLYTCDNQS